MSTIEFVFLQLPNDSNQWNSRRTTAVQSSLEFQEHHKRDSPATRSTGDGYNLRVNATPKKFYNFLIHQFKAAYSRLRPYSSTLKKCKQTGRRTTPKS